MPRSEDRRLHDILEAAFHITTFLEGRSEATFVGDVMARSAVLYQLVIVGEATAALSVELRERYPSVPWAAIVGFRNRVVHGYHEVDWQVVWDTATIDLPALVTEIATILNQRLQAPDPGEPEPGDVG